MTSLRFRKGTNKYKARRVTIGGETYDSKGEAMLAHEIAMMIRAGELVRVQRQVSIPLEVNDKLICTHRVDFMVELPGGGIEVWEFKGFETPEWKLKRKLFESLYPSIPYRVRKSVRV
jgi:hypothetical protein